MNDNTRATAPGTDDLAFWNACFEVMTILYSAFFQNQDMGCPVLDLFSQLKATMHFSHAIMENGQLALGMRQHVAAELANKVALKWMEEIDES